MKLPRRQKSRIRDPETPQGGLITLKKPKDPAVHDFNIIAIHGLETTSPRTWEHHKGDPKINWLTDDTMLPAAMPKAQIWAYNWTANFYNKSIEAPLHDHARHFLKEIKKELGPEPRPIIFVASCFGGLLLAKTLVEANEAKQDPGMDEGPYEYILRATVGILFLGTPFRGSSAASIAQWQVSMGRVLGRESSKGLVKSLNEHDEQLDEIRMKFTQLMRRPKLEMPIECVYETRKTRLLRRVVRGYPERMLTYLLPRTHLIVVHRSSACLDGYDALKSEATHALMNKFENAECQGYQAVRGSITTFASKAKLVQEKRLSTGARTYDTIPSAENMDFVGREEILNKLRDAIPPTKSETCRRYAITGLDGVGKTELALKAVYRLREDDEDCSIFWVRANNFEIFRKDYRKIADCLGIRWNDKDKFELIDKVNEELHKRSGRWLLVVDGADECEDILRKSVELPHSRRGSILLTAGNISIVHFLEATPVPLEGLGDAEALQLLKQGLIVGSDGHISSDDNDQDTVDLLNELAGLPLAIKLASTYLRESPTTVSKYLKIWRETDQNMIDRLCRQPDTEEEQSSNISTTSRRAVAASWLITLSHLRKTHPVYLECLRHLAFLSPKNIPISMLEAAMKVNLDDVIKALVSYFFVTKPSPGADTIDLHPLVQRAMKTWLERYGNIKKARTSTVDEIAKSNLPFPTQDSLGWWGRQLEHVEAALRETDDSVYDRSAWRLLYAVGQVKFLTGDYDGARRYHGRARQLERLKVAMAPNLAPGLRRQGRDEEAQKEYEEFISREREFLEEGHPSITAVQRNLACTSLLQGSYQRATAQYREALDTERRMLGEHHPCTISTMESVAFALKSDGKDAEVIDQYEGALRLKKTFLGRTNPSTIATMENLALMYQRRGMHNEARDLFVELLQVKERVFDKSHPSLLWSQRALDLARQRVQPVQPT
ncbi:uncharacterized protein BJX67DRAFT_379844 [Aspergillus lucknowensis]|uniref:NACHT domain-containing protein n=1 Tax=Aspergillus lucknowensis TaxID=176173 RepID=A0ABR4LWJ4_9EURO